MKMLAITSAQRSPLMPDLPTMREGGVTDYELIGWFALLAPANTPFQSSKHCRWRSRIPRSIPASSQRWFHKE